MKALVKILLTTILMEVELWGVDAFCGRTMFAGIPAAILCLQTEHGSLRNGFWKKNGEFRNVAASE